MAKALQCDRCGQFYSLLKGLRNYQIRDMNEKNFDKQVDLCPDCYEIFTKWLMGEKEQEVGTGEFESKHYEFEDCDNIKGERVIRCQESQ